MIKIDDPHANERLRKVRLFALLTTLVLVAAAVLPGQGKEAPELLLFIGRLHPILVHLPIGCILALLVLELLDLWISSVRLHQATHILLWLTALSAVGSALCGALLSLGGGYDAELLYLHRWLGTLLAVIMVAMLPLRIRFDAGMGAGTSFAYYLSLVAATAVTMGAGHVGGSITHGEDYLTYYMPNPLRSVLRTFPPRAPAPEPPSVTDPEASIYDAIIHPILDSACVACHNASKFKGGLRMDTLDLTMQGGESGPSIVAGRPDKSLLLARLRLPLDDEHHMPPKGKPQLSASQVALLEWWIEIGAPARDTLSMVTVPEPIRDILGVAAAAAAAVEPPLDAEALDQLRRHVDRLVAELGVSILPVSAGTPAYRLSCLNVADRFGDEQLAAVAPIADRLVSLDLADSKVTSAGLAALAGMTRLERLDLHGTVVSNEAMAVIAELPKLTYLNLYGTRVDDEGVLQLAGLKRLRQLFIWDTAVSADAAHRLRTEIPGLEISRGWEQDLVDRLRIGVHAQYVLHGSFDERWARQEPGVPVDGEVPFEESERGPAARFDGKACVTLEGVAEFEYTNRFTCAAWVYPTVVAPMSIMGRMDDEHAARGIYRGYDMYLDGGFLVASLIHDWPEIAISVKSKTALAVNKWQHVAFSYSGTGDGDGVVLYLNGAVVASEAVQHHLCRTLQTAQPFRIGRRAKASGFKGMIREVRIYDRVLTGPELQQLHLYVEPPPPPPPAPEVAATNAVEGALAATNVTADAVASTNVSGAAAAATNAPAPVSASATGAVERAEAPK